MCRETKLLLLVSTIFTLAMGLSNIFVNIFFWRESSNLKVMVIYNLIHYIALPITFIAAGWLAKRKNGVWSLRIGIILFSLFFSLILFFGNEAVKYIYPLGALLGIASGFYWLAFHTLSFDFTTVENRDTFNGYNGSCGGIAGAIAPISAGFIISSFKEIKGYYIVFAITLGLFVLLLFLTLFLKCKKYGDRLKFSRVFGKNCEEWNTIRKATTLWGFRDVIIGFIINILIIQTTGSELSLGKISLLASLICSASYVIAQRVIKPSRRKLAVRVGALFSFVAVWGLFIKVQYSTLLIYSIIDAFFMPFFTIVLSSSTFNVINGAHEDQLRIEYLVNKELVLNLGRVMSNFILFILLSTIRSGVVLNYFLLLIGAAPIFSGYFLIKLKKVLEGV